MKNILPIVFILFIGGSVLGQEKVATYYNNFVDETYEILLDAKSENDFTIYVKAFSLENPEVEGGFLVDQKQYENFISALNGAKEKYLEWVKIAMENDVKKLSKEMTYTAKVDGFFRYAGKWKIHMNVPLTFEIKISEKEAGVQYLLIIRTGTLTSIDNQFIKVKGYVLTFLSEKDIQAFITVVSKEKLAEYISKIKGKEDLFKN